MHELRNCNVRLQNRSGRDLFIITVDTQSTINPSLSWSAVGSAVDCGAFCGGLRFSDLPYSSPRATGMSTVFVATSLSNCLNNDKLQNNPLYPKVKSSPYFCIGFRLLQNSHFRRSHFCNFTFQSSLQHRLSDLPYLLSYENRLKKLKLSTLKYRRLTAET